MISALFFLFYRSVIFFLDRRKKRLLKRKKKEVHPKRSYKGFFRKMFWFGFFGILGLAVISCIRSVNLDSRLENVSKEVEEQKQTLKAVPTEEVNEMTVNEDGAKNYACNFLTDFYTWSYDENKAEERAERLKKYLCEGMELNAGYDISRLGTASAVNNCEVWEVLIEDDSVKVTVKVAYTLKEQVVNEMGTSENVVAQEQKYVVVVLATDGKSFKVKDNPYVVQAPAELEYKLQSVNDNTTLVTDDMTKSEIDSFMETYFKMATTATAEEMKYYATTDTDSLSMLGLYAFVKIDSSSIYKTESGYKVFVDVRLQDLSTKAEVVLKTKCCLKQTEERLTVESIDY